jgi:NAD+ synthase
MARNFEQEIKDRVTFIKQVLESAHASGIVYGNSGGKDSTLTGILCKMACDDTVGIIMPCFTERNYYEDVEDALKIAESYNIETRRVDLGTVRTAFSERIQQAAELSPWAVMNITPRLRMSVLYAVAASENRLVSGTGNRSEAYMGYFTKWGDGAHDFNPIGDLTVSEIYEFLEYLQAPRRIIEKPPSAGLFEGQSDEEEMGITYAKVDRYLLQGEAEPADLAIIEKLHSGSVHKRKAPLVYGGNNDED